MCRCFSRITLCSLIAGSLLTGALPQDSSSDSDQTPPQIRVAVEAVNLFVTVFDKRSGDFIKHLVAEDFEVYEDGDLQQITNFAAETDLPLTIAMAIDTSSSVRIKLDFEKEVATDFLYSVMRTTDRALLAEFDTGVTLLHDYTHNPNDLANVIKNLKAGGGTSMYDAIYLITEQKMIEEAGRKTLVILSDGADLTSTHTFEQALKMCFKAEATIFAVSTTRLGADIDHEGDNALRQLTEDTGGRAWFPITTSEMSKAFNKINDILRNQYSITYVPTRKQADGQFRKIRVKVRNLGGSEIHHRKGYYADWGEPGD